MTRETLDSHEPSGRSRRQRLLLALLALGIGLYVTYAGRRTAVEPQEGIGISWPDHCQPVAKTRFRVATYNIHRGKGTDGVRDLRRIARVLAEADVIGLNEVAGPAFPGQSDQAEQLGKALEIGWLFAPNQRRWHMYHFGNGLLSRLAVGPWTSEPLVYDSDRSRSHRNLLTTQITVAQCPVTVMITHLDRGEIRSDQLEDVLEAFEEHEPAILMGDFNSDPDDPLLTAFFADSNNVDAIGAGLTEADSSGRIDWIITRGMRVLSGGLEPVGVSDHPCYWVDVEVTATNVDANSPMTRFAER
jgi:endonuclease/exonuclease/phosphatase family metal-dependent hydrolase